VVEPAAEPADVRARLARQQLGQQRADRVGALRHRRHTATPAAFTVNRPCPPPDGTASFHTKGVIRMN
jgi:hypothetical protein